MQAKSLGIAAMTVASPPMGFVYFARTIVESREAFADYVGGGILGFGVNVVLCVAAELIAFDLTKPYPEISYSTPEITLRYDKERNDLREPRSNIEMAVSLATSYGIVAPFFRDRAFSPVTELSVTPSPDYSCQWEMNGHIPLEWILETRPYNTLNPEILLGNMVKATDAHILDYARETCRARLETEKQSRSGL